jgi:peptide/nickel transport system permease protein
MLPYLIRRLLLAIPALWLMATAVFLLSRLLPGSFATERILQQEAGYYSKGNDSDRQAAYHDYMRRTGQDQPLFYFSVTPDPQPADSIFRRYTEAQQRQLQKLSWHYGNAKTAESYIKSMLLLQKELEQYNESSLVSYLPVLQQETNYAALHTAAKNSLEAAKFPQVIKAAEQVLARLEQMQRQKEPLVFLKPQLSWHGSHNQYHQWLVRLLQGDLGSSYRNSRPVMVLLAEAIGNTWWLLICSMVLTFVLALELSILMAQTKGRALRRYMLPALFIADSIPLFVLALVLMVLLANPKFLQLFPVFGMGFYSSQQLSLWQQATQWGQYMALPMLCLVLANLPYVTNQIYASINMAMQADYTRTAKAKGLAEGAIIRRHALRNALLPIITIVSDFLPALVAGTFVIETIFALPGIGRLLIESALSRDYPVLVGIILVIAAFRMVAYLLADLGYAWADPRIKQQLA